MDDKEHFTEINLLVEKIAEALGLSPREAAQAIESGRLAIAMETDADGRACLGLRLGDRAARLIADD